VRIVLALELVFHEVGDLEGVAGVDSTISVLQAHKRWGSKPRFSDYVLLVREQVLGIFEDFP